MTTASVVAANRFGLGARPGELAEIGDDPRGWLKAQINARHAKPPSIAGLSGSEARLANVPATMSSGEGAPKTPFQAVLRMARFELARDSAARLQAALSTPTPFVERLLAFWANHFTVSALKTAAAGMIGPYETEAIRPHLFGRFADLLKAVTLHPAMLLYLDNWNSFGPRSQAGLLHARGLNENLARELMELHTLGVDGGYTQTDVTELAKILTGWTVNRPQEKRGIAASRGGAVFLPALHEPGDKFLLGKRYPDQAEQEADAALDVLASHPGTARFIATKLARHFIADDPPVEAVAALSTTFARTDGDLSAVYAALIDLDPAWVDGGKYRTPYDWVIAIFRAFAAEKSRDVSFAIQAVKQLGQRLHYAPSPAGWPDDSSWLAPEALLERIKYAATVGQSRGEIDPSQLADATLGTTISSDSKFAIEHAPSRGDSIALLLVSPEFLNR